MTNDTPLTPPIRQAEDMANNPTLRYFTEVRQQEPEYEFDKNFKFIFCSQIIGHPLQLRLFGHYSM